MKIAPLPSRREQGFIALITFLLMGIMFILALASVRSGLLLRRDVRLLEQRQMQRLNPTMATTATNFIPPHP